MSYSGGGAFSALGSRNYRLFFSGQAVSLTGFWIQRVAMGWLIYRLTDSPFLLGAVDFASQIPLLFLSTVAGVMMERWDLRRLMIICQTLCMVHAGFLAALTLTGTVQYWHVLALGVLLGIVNAFELPARQTFVVQLVDRPEDLSNAVALNSSLFNVARLIGPSVAGFCIAAFGEGICFGLNSAFYLATLLALMAMRLKPHRVEPSKEGFFEGLSSGIGYVRRFLPIRDVLLSLALLSFAGLPYLVLLPVFAKEILHGGPGLLGLLTGASGLGALVGSIRLAARKTPVGLMRVMALSMCGFGVALSCFALSDWALLSVPLIVFVGFCMVSILVAGNTVVQTLVEEDKRSRVMALYVVALTGTAPIGSLISGAVASLIGAQMALAIGGIVCLGAGMILVKRGDLLWSMAEPIYITKGLLVQSERGELPVVSDAF
ncbi:MFS transporter [Dethiosulfovibrio salsuginis]|uniref:Predicted arabinose efflux permease, MFS family n=1 Tax=Dethiosulfovibrio salsuginis TaxID=561720 RepID=A0A1X7KFR9_9BACT|nr:MFS transporter [Dethiosulfovibrio salsuginis]SMG39324.1 Predicted arabinose efflux permease, MFS family [Dethiosulfovibrio salsuginis]